MKAVTSKHTRSPVSAVASLISKVKSVGVPPPPPPPPPPVPISIDPDNRSTGVTGDEVIASIISIAVGVSEKSIDTVSSEPVTSKHTWNNEVPSATVAPFVKSELLNQDKVMSPAFGVPKFVGNRSTRLMFCILL